MRLHRILFIGMALFLGGEFTATAQTRLPDMPLEDLLQIDSGRVFSASLRTQPATEAPSSVTFITAEDIARFGYRSLADVLNAVRGFYVTNDRNFSFLGSRGFGKPGDYNSRVLLLVNGHRVNDNVFGQAEIGLEFGLDPAVFERIEIIRGPGSSLYGDSAFFAVVNVITKSGASLNGASIAADAGSLGTRALRGSAGRQFTNGLEVAVYGTYEEANGVRRLYFPAFDAPSTNGGIAEGLDGEGLRATYLQLQAKGLTFTGAYGSRQRHVPTASFGTLFNEQQFPEQTTDRHSLADLEYDRPLLGNGRFAVRGSYDRFTYQGTYPFAADDEAARPLVGQNGVIGSRWTVGARLTHPLPARQVATAGAEWIANTTQRQLFRYANPESSVFDIDRSSRQTALYLDDQMKLWRGLFVNGGLRYDGYERFTRVTPRAGVIVTPSVAQSFKYLYGKAFRAPNEYERNSFYFGSTVEALRPETVATHEVVWERYADDWLRTSVSAYRYHAERLITLVPEPEAFLGTTFVNAGRVVAKGLEFEAEMRLGRGVQALSSYALQEAKDSESGQPLVNSPRHMVKARATGPIPLGRSTLSGEVVFLSSRRTISGYRLGHAATADVTIMVPVTSQVALTGSAYNLFDVHYLDPASDAHRQDVIPQNGRTLRISARVTLGKP